MLAARLYGARDLRLRREADPVPGPTEVVVRVAAVGLCGSDLHWWEDGGVGDDRAASPLILGYVPSGLEPEAVHGILKAGDWHYFWPRLVLPITIEPGTNYQASWFDPRTGDRTPIGPVAPEPNGRWTPPAQALPPRLGPRPRGRGTARSPVMTTGGTRAATPRSPTESTRKRSKHLSGSASSRRCRRPDRIRYSGSR